MDPLLDDSKSREQQMAQLSSFCEALWLKRQMTDVEVQVDAEVFQAHKLILTCHSPYFHKLLINTKPEMLKASGAVQLNGITHESFSVLLAYMYTGRLQLTCQNIVDVFQAAKHLDMKCIKERCAQVLTSSPEDPVHALFVYVSAKKLGTKPAWQRAYKTILAKFHLVVDCPEFTELSVDQVCEILAADSIAARSETELFLAALSWLSAKWPAREQHIVELLKCIRFSSMPMEEAVACFHPPLLPEVTAKPEVREMLNNAVCYISAKQVGQESKFKQYTHPQRCFLLKGKQQRSPEKGMGDASTMASSSRASSLSPPPTTAVGRHRRPRRRRGDKARAAAQQASSPGSAEEDGSPVSPPGGNAVPPRALEIPTAGDKEAAEAWLGDPLLHEVLHSRALTERTRVLEWDEYAAKALPEDSRIRRGSPGLLLVGGIDPCLPHQVSTGCAVLAYEEADDRWHRVAMLPEPRHHHAGAIVGDNVYVIGGLNSRRTLTGRPRPLASCLCYQLGERQWTQLPDLQVPRAYHGCAAVEGTLFAVGGRDKRGRLLDSMECWEPSSDRWRLTAEPLRPGRMGAAVCASGKKVYVAGGVARSDDGRLWLLADVDCYDLQAGRWFRGPRLPWPVCLGSLVSTGSGVLVHVGGLSLCPAGGAAVEKVPAGAMLGGAIHQQDAGAAVDARAFRSRSDVLFWDPSSADGRWKSLCPLPEPRHGMGAAVCANEDTLYVLGGLSTSLERAPLEVLAASTADSSDRSFYKACQLPGPIAGSLVLPLPDVASIPVSRRRSSSS
ncbi:hypothetical protein HPB49_024100 [Dermacentor silvarum]|uniref:Uncharacterized protein n=1 Tax=Dermacentor silvarum TaxID=543639 RepID=A0ACB8DL29_DERSI|nr:hypothetical protein HPB49_024100 [Dermacentor silvarum]